MKLRRWIRMFAGSLLIALVGMGCIGCDDSMSTTCIEPPDSASEADDQGATVGQFCVVGEVARPGVYSLTDRLTTLKMAVLAAGKMSAHAWPEHLVLTRRVGENQEKIVLLNIDKILSGEEPDIVLRPHDFITVGTAAFSITIQGATERPTGGRDHAPHRVLRERCDDKRRFTRW